MAFLINIVLKGRRHSSVDTIPTFIFCIFRTVTIRKTYIYVRPKKHVSCHPQKQIKACSNKVSKTRLHYSSILETSLSPKMFHTRTFRIL